MSYDAKCYDLAYAFLSDYGDADLPHPRAKLAHELAQAIQTTIEDYLETELMP